MKRIKLNKIVWSFLIVLSLFTFSCSNDDNSSGTNTPPVIEKVSPTLDEDGVPSQLESVNVGYANNMYIIQGSGLKTVKKIYFNDFEAAFNQTKATGALAASIFHFGEVQIQDLKNNLKIKKIAIR